MRKVESRGWLRERIYSTLHFLLSKLSPAPPFTREGEPYIQLNLVRM
jgi:hypothetical protein